MDEPIEVEIFETKPEPVEVVYWDGKQSTARTILEWMGSFYPEQRATADPEERREFQSYYAEYPATNGVIPALHFFGHRRPIFADTWVVRVMYKDGMHSHFEALTTEEMEKKYRRPEETRG